jgi:hypothetical protein
MNIESEAGAFEREITPEELQQLERERAERLDPANRPGNAEIDNTTREWDYEHDDFRDNLEGNPPAFDQGDGSGTARDPEIWARLQASTD